MMYLHNFLYWLFINDIY